MAEQEEIPSHLEPWSDLLPNGWPAGAGPLPDSGAVEQASDLGIKPGTKVGLAWVMYCRPKGATQQEVTVACGSPQLNRASDAHDRGEVVFNKEKRINGKTAYFLGPPKSGNRSAYFTTDGAKRILSKRFQPIGPGTDNISGFKTPTGRQLALAQSRRGVYIWIEEDPSVVDIPCIAITNKKHPGQPYAPDQRRNSNLKTQAPRLAMGHRAFYLNVETEVAFEQLLDWYETLPPTDEGVPTGQDGLEALKQTFLHHFPDFKDFRDKSTNFYDQERRYKEEFIEAYRNLVRPHFEAVEKGGSGEEAVAAFHKLLTAEKIPSTKKVQNLLDWRSCYHMSQFTKEESEQAARLFVDLLWKGGSVEDRIDHFVEAYWPIMDAAHERSVAKKGKKESGQSIIRSIPTLLLMLEDPKRNIYIRTKLFDNLCQHLHGEKLFEWASRLSGADYRGALKLADEVRRALKKWGWHPQDMIDVQSFIWVAASGSYEEDEEIDMGETETLPSDLVTDDQNIWLISPGSGAILWDEWQADGIVSIGWEEVGNLKEYTTLDDVRERLGEVFTDQDSIQNALACHEFAHSMKPGDLIFAKFGRREVIGFGQIKSDYVFDETRSVHQHVRGVDWLRVGNWPYTGERMFPMKALTNITKNIVLCEALLTLVGADQEGVDPVSYEEPDFEAIKKAIEDEGMRLTPETIQRYHLSLKTRGFVILSGNSGTGKTWLAEAYAKSVNAEKLIVPVAPNWTTNEDLLGYFNPLDETYHDTPFSAFLKRAEGEHRRTRDNGIESRPFHLILDEMNLARVEYYFAKFLSAMELRARNGEAEIELAPGKMVMLPPNLSFIGTVNIDETTQSFADKVYDRAQMVEIESPRELIRDHLGEAPYAEHVLRVWDAVKDVAPFAYRVIDDIGVYTKEANELGIDWETALDHQIEQKVLTKVKGADPRIEAALNGLLEIAADHFPRTHVKVQVMLARYEQHGFTSYF